ncbi:hypothetical protein BDF22DRAFT_654598 [Syncephalis plumigaleata]|nr:hypothetical protein BDF22DRAFT_654598 [Syncephalis plumigaleata]
MQSVFIYLSAVLFALLTIFQYQASAEYTKCTYDVFNVTEPSSITLGSNTTVKWTVPKELSYFSFNIELWYTSSGPDGPAVERLVKNLGSTNSSSTPPNADGQYTWTSKVDSVPSGSNILYFIAVYGRYYINGPAQTSLHPWDPIYYGKKPVTINKS